MHIFPIGIRVTWNAISLIQNLNSGLPVHSLRRSPLRHKRLQHFFRSCFFSKRSGLPVHSLRRSPLRHKRLQHFFLKLFFQQTVGSSCSLPTTITVTPQTSPTFFFEVVFSANGRVFLFTPYDDHRYATNVSNIFFWSCFFSKRSGLPVHSLRRSPLRHKRLQHFFLGLFFQQTVGSSCSLPTTITVTPQTSPTFFSGVVFSSNGRVFLFTPYDDHRYATNVSNIFSEVVFSANGRVFMFPPYDDHRYATNVSNIFFWGCFFSKRSGLPVHSLRRSPLRHKRLQHFFLRLFFQQTVGSSCSLPTTITVTPQTSPTFFSGVVFFSKRSGLPVHSLRRSPLRHKRLQHFFLGLFFQQTVRSKANNF